MTHAEIAARREAVMDAMGKEVAEVRKKHLALLAVIEEECGAIGHIKPIDDGWFPGGCAICGASRRVFSRTYGTGCAVSMSSGDDEWK
jgi:hypothetical protein